MFITTSLEVLVELRPQRVRMDDSLRLAGWDDQFEQRAIASRADRQVLEFAFLLQWHVTQLVAPRMEHVGVRDVVLAGAVFDLHVVKRAFTRQELSSQRLHASRGPDDPGFRLPVSWLTTNVSIAGYSWPRP
jgi:hypothetical protein